MNELSTALETNRTVSSGYCPVNGHIDQRVVRESKKLTEHLNNNKKKITKAFLEEAVISSLKVKDRCHSRDMFQMDANRARVCKL